MKLLKILALTIILASINSHSNKPKDIKTLPKLKPCKKCKKILEGPKGLQGIQGNQGIRGPDGIKGPDGDKGCKGDSGPKGDTGSKGPDGLPGDDGKDSIGENGSDGKNGLDGTACVCNIERYKLFLCDGIKENNCDEEIRDLRDCEENCDLSLKGNDKCADIVVDQACLDRCNSEEFLNECGIKSELVLEKLKEQCIRECNLNADPKRCFQLEQCKNGNRDCLCKDRCDKVELAKEVEFYNDCIDPEKVSCESLLNDSLFSIGNDYLIEDPVKENDKTGGDKHFVQSNGFFASGPNKKFRLIFCGTEQDYIDGKLKFFIYLCVPPRKFLVSNPTKDEVTGETPGALDEPTCWELKKVENQETYTVQIDGTNTFWRRNDGTTTQKIDLIDDLNTPVLFNKCN